jgi:hypothetical protein
MERSAMDLGHSAHDRINDIDVVVIFGCAGIQKMLCFEA